MNRILKEYNRKARPVQKETDVVDIFIDIALPQLMKVVSVFLSVSSNKSEG